MKPSFETSAETRKLIDLFRVMPLKQEMTFAEASEKVGFGVNSDLSAYTSARKIAERDHGVFIGTQRGVGFMRGDGRDMVKSGYQFARSILRKGKRAASRMELAMQQNLPQTEHMRASELYNRFQIIVSNSEPAKSNRRTVQEPPQI